MLCKEKRKAFLSSKENTKTEAAREIYTTMRNRVNSRMGTVYKIH